ncbi:MAG: lysylphosphatidylglycerol synthase transmembrane domain-containing protein [Bacteroidota bacterium]
MKFTLKTSIQYLLSLSFGGVLLWWLYREKDYQELYNNFKEINYFWVGMSGVAALISYWARAYRWRIALTPFHLHVNTFNATLAVMVGYFANLFAPRIGEFVRSGVLKRTDDAPVNISFGAIIAERAIDLLILLLLTGTVLLVEFDKVGHFVIDKIQQTSGSMFIKLLILMAVGIAGVASLFLLYRYRSRFKKNFIYNKAVDFFKGIKEGVLSIIALDFYGQLQYISLTLCIWLMYFLMTYFFFFSLEETSMLGVRCALTTLIMASIGMAIPTPGGMGSYHIFVAFSLSVYGLSPSISSDFALLMHTTQSLVLVVLGALSLVITLIIFSKKKKKAVLHDIETNVVP